MKKLLFLMPMLFATFQIAFLRAESDEQNEAFCDVLISAQKSFSEYALSMTGTGNTSLEEMSQFVNSACYTCIHAHTSEYQQNVRDDLGRPNNGSPPEVIAARHMKQFIDDVVDDLAMVARNFQGEDRELFWTLAAKNVTKSMLGLLRGRKDEYGIERHINSKINLKKLIG